MCNVLNLNLKNKKIIKIILNVNVVLKYLCNLAFLMISSGHFSKVRRNLRIKPLSTTHVCTRKEYLKCDTGLIILKRGSFLNRDFELKY